MKKPKRIIAAKKMKAFITNVFIIILLRFPYLKERLRLFSFVNK